MGALILAGLGFVGGLVVGWWFLPQPAWVKKIYDAAFHKDTVPATDGK